MKSMTKKAISPGAVHSVPADLLKAVISDPAARAKWEDITPLARKKPGQYRVVRLPDQDQLIALLLNDHCAALVRSSTR